MKKPVCKIFHQEGDMTLGDFQKKINDFLAQYCSEGNLIGPVQIACNGFGLRQAAITYYKSQEEDVPIAELAKRQILPHDELIDNTIF